MPHFDEAAFEQKLELALGQVRTLLDNTRHPLAPASVPHGYEDKFRLAEFLTRTAMGGVLTALEAIGLDAEKLATLREWARVRTVTLRFEVREECAFLGEKTRQVESPVQRVTEIEGPSGREARIRDKIVTTVTEYWWNYEFSYRLYAFQGNSSESGVTICAQSGNLGLRTSTNRTPRPQGAVHPAIDGDLTWLFQQVDEQGQLAFAIDRDDRRCHTPRRNLEVDAAIACFTRFARWSSSVSSFIKSELLPIQSEPALGDFDRSALNLDDLFSPVVPLFEGDGQGEAARDVLPLGHVNAFLAEQRRRLELKRAKLAEVFPSNKSLITLPTMVLLVAFKHGRQVCRDYGAGVDYVEQLLRQQLVAAIGRVLEPSDFADYMSFHYRKLFKPEFRPQPFSYAVRRPHHDPEGTLSLEVLRDDWVPVSSVVQHRSAGHAMRFPLDAATEATFLGERHLHAWVAHQFSGSSEALKLVARARQFSSYILLVGRIAAADRFEPSHAIVVQNKDVLEIPLELEQIPTPKEFRDAIESLSPEQQRFAKSFRGMQLESTLFGVCVIQIKPQLERLLKLPPDGLTKEIKLTQDLLELFMEHQIPSDLLAYEGPEDASPEDKLERVRGYVGQMQGMIDEAREKALAEARQREAYRRAESDRSLRAPDPGSGAFLLDTASYDPFGDAAPRAMASSFGGDPFGGGGGDPFAAPGAADPFGAPAEGLSLDFAGGDPFAAPPAPPQAAPEPAAPDASKPSEPSEPSEPREPKPYEVSEGGAGGGGVDYTRIPALLDRRVEALDDDSALRATIINPGDPWQKTFRKTLLAEAAQKSLDAEEQRTEKDKAFDLIDALSKSGDLAFEHASLHVVIASTHCFDKTLLETVVQANVNPIEKVERSAMIVATTIHDRPPQELLLPDQQERFFASSPRLGGAVERALEDRSS